MEQEINGYIEYLTTCKDVEKPTMPYFDVLAYTDNEYLSVVFDMLKDFDCLDSEYVTIVHLKGE